MRIGIFFGGQSREREISFAGGRTVYDNLNKGLFEAVPIFVDSHGKFILLNWEHIYKGSIRDFYPPVASVPASAHGFQIYAESLAEIDKATWLEIAQKVGKPLQAEELADHIDFAFLALHGPYGEDGNLQGMLEWFGIPYSGSGVLPSAIGIDKYAQKKLMASFGLPSPAFRLIKKDDWHGGEPASIFKELKETLGLPFVLKAPHQGSSIGVKIVSEDRLDLFSRAIAQTFFSVQITAGAWAAMSGSEKKAYLAQLIDLRYGIGMPLYCQTTGKPKLVYHPDELWEILDQASQQLPAAHAIQLEATENEPCILAESFIPGREFSCIVIQDHNEQPLALPPTEIVKKQQVFDYRAKYLPGISRKITPISLPTEQIQSIQLACQELFTLLQCNVYARIDGFIDQRGGVFLNDPNTTSGMLPSSFFFHQAAEIGLNPSQFLTYIIRTSLEERTKTGKKTHLLKAQIERLDAAIEQQQQAAQEKIVVGVLMGGYSAERHISVESGRNIFEKLSSSEKYLPIPLFLTGKTGDFQIYEIPVSIMLKDNADDIAGKINSSLAGELHPVLQITQQKASSITKKYAGQVLHQPKKLEIAQLKEIVSAVFIALHGRPGEDGAIQQELLAHGIPFNGSGVASSQTTIDKYLTKEVLKASGFSVAKHTLVHRADWQKDADAILADLAQTFGYPFIAKPSDDGCSAAVKKIKSPEEFRHFAEAIFRPEETLAPQLAEKLQLSPGEEFPQKQLILVEELITANGADIFLEITGGLLTHQTPKGPQYQIFEPSETLASKEILSLEEKFLAGEGQNITPARFNPDPVLNGQISEIVRNDLEKAATLLNIEGYARIDAFVRIYLNHQKLEKVETIIIEANSLPGMTPATCIFHQTALSGYKPYDFIDAILTYGLNRPTA